MSDVLPEGVFDMKLVSITGFVSKQKQTPYLQALFSSAEVTQAYANLPGTFAHITAWRRCIGQTFTLSVKHRILRNGIILPSVTVIH